MNAPMQSPQRRPQSIPLPTFVNLVVEDKKGRFKYVALRNHKDFSFLQVAFFTKYKRKAEVLTQDGLKQFAQSFPDFWHKHREKFIYVSTSHIGFPSDPDNRNIPTQF